MKYIKNFTKISKSDIQIAGGKGASLGEMTRLAFGSPRRAHAGIPVPPGFVVLAQAFEKFLESAQIKTDIETILEKVNHEDTNSIDGASAEIKSIILGVKMPDEIQKEIVSEFEKLRADYVAVRSSATAEDSSSASWAGELETYLNVTEKNLLESVQKCWASLFTPRAIFYRFEKGLHKTKVSVAVVVQKMIQSEISGICFTVHPVTQDKNQMVIEAGYGLGEAIVGGKITPDTYIINKSEIHPVKSGKAGPPKAEFNRVKIAEKNISEQKMMIVRGGEGTEEKNVPENLREKQKLPDKKILELSEICLKIEKHYNYPQDIEWAADKNLKLYITQSRPITTLK